MKSEMQKSVGSENLKKCSLVAVAFHLGHTLQNNNAQGRIKNTRPGLASAQRMQVLDIFLVKDNPRRNFRPASFMPYWYGSINFCIVK